ncbi:dipeptidase [Streptomyces liangshanensis]|uniref:Membrane dipeptidase n=1 Tax=Streptomyces liangshanensis TaxID=2717324 RepID=A0A6G9H1U6_9ACTN|nr:dipeptidase [Streptomyces liangshanensis]QIQ04512.1 membrane dipeptidase [Streptomyces liangshanensis]
MADLQDDPYTDTTTAPSTPPDTAPADAVDTTPVDATPFDVVDPRVGSDERARALLAAHPVIDGHNSLAQALRHMSPHDLELGEAALDTDIPRIRAGGVGGQFWSLVVPGQAADQNRAISSTLELIDLLRSLISDCPEGLRLALNAGDLSDARNCGRVASFLGPVAGYALGDSIGTLRGYHALGVRCVALAGAGWAADGLTRFGQEMVREMNRLGVLVDLSGTSGATMRAGLAVAKAPVLLSRSAAGALTDHPANVADDVLALLPANHGVCMVSFAPEQVVRAAGRPSVRDVADHVEHVRKVAGPECVGLSGTYGLAADTPRTAGLEDSSRYPALIAELFDRGWDETDLAALTWGNAARVVRDVEFAARAAQQRRGPSSATMEDLDGR